MSLEATRDRTPSSVGIESKASSIRKNRRSARISKPTLTGAVTQVASTVTGTTVILGAYLAFAGWKYAWTLFQEFGISARGLDIPAEQYLFYSFDVVMKWQSLVFLVLVGSFGAVLWRYGPRLFVPLTFVIFLALFPLLGWRAAAEAQSSADELASSSAFVVLRFKPAPEGTAPDEIQQHNCKPDPSQPNPKCPQPFRLLTQTKEQLVVFYRDDHSLKHAFLISKADLYYAETISP